MPSPVLPNVHTVRIAVVGLGYVGLPVAIAFDCKGFDVVGFDISISRIAELREGRDRTGEVEGEALSSFRGVFSTSAADLSRVNFFIVTVPTPINDARQPDLTALLAASRTVGETMQPGSAVVYESTVYPGATEEDCVPVLEQASGLICGRDFWVGYSPERINPGDKQHQFQSIRKVVSGQDAQTLDLIADVYGAVVEAGIHRAPSIRVAEAAKVIENAQRDLNIAFMNELSSIFRSLGVDTYDVLEAARTKWNFLPFTPGLVGGHCIGIDPYYLTHRAERAGYHPQVILAGRRINDDFGVVVARECVRLLMQNGMFRQRVAVLGLTFKENVPDIRNSRVIDIVHELQRYAIDPLVCDPHADPAEAQRDYGIELIELDALEPCDAIILAVSHREFVEAGWALVSSLLRNGKGIVLDVKARLDRTDLPLEVVLWRP